jgi:hypothetical protein
MESTSMVNLVVNLEYRKLTGHSAARANRDIEKDWAYELAIRVNRFEHQIPTYDVHVICEYITFLQFNESRSKYFTLEFEEFVADLIKRHILYESEYVEYEEYCKRFVSR